MSILSNRVDCLLFGHTTPNGVLQDSYREWEKSYGIPLINCENLEHGNDQRLPISVIDLKQNHVEVYSSYLTNTVPIIQRGYKNIKGKYHIVQPIVNTGARIYYNGIAGKEEIEFRSGDKVTIKAGGGVQTGGSGQTWKRYVNPSGTNSNRLYFGKVFIPGITPSLTAFRDLVNNYGKYTQAHECTLQFTIPSFAVQPFLMLQYIDDNYSDNGYSGHDDGTENQCKGVGAAYVNIKIERTVKV